MNGLTPMLEDWTPSPDMRKRVLMYAFNGVPPQRIASILGITTRQLRRHFAHELDNGEEELLAWCAANVLQLAAQQENPSVALQANSQMLQARKKNWRIPKVEALQEEEGEKRVSRMSLEEVEAELERMEARRAGHV